MRLLKDQIAVITGASSGIGKSIALELAQREAILCLLGRNVARLQAVADQAKKSTRQVECYQVDLSKDQEIFNFGMSISKQFISADINKICISLLSERQPASPAGANPPLGTGSEF